MTSSTRARVMHDRVGINAVMPTAEQIDTLLELPDAPILMFNLLKFDPDGGAEAYARYAKSVVLVLKKFGAVIEQQGA